MRSDLRSDAPCAEASTSPAEPPGAGAAVGSGAPAHTPLPAEPDHPPEPDRRRWRRWWVGVAGLVVVLAGVVGVLGWTGQARPLARSVHWWFDPPPPAKVHVVPAATASGVRLDTPVRLTATRGHLTRVQVVAAGGERLAGGFTHDRRGWASTAPLAPDTRYTVRWTAVNPQDKQARQTTTFTTLTPAAALGIQEMLPEAGETVGVGQPIIVRFDQPVADKAAVERGLQVQHSEGMHGAWNWLSDTEVRYRPQTYWPAHATVRVDLELAGVDAGGGVWGTEDQSLSFEIGPRIVSTVDVTTLQMTVEVDGVVVRELPMSAGRAGWETQNGVHTVLSKTDFAIFSIPGLYSKPVEYAVRLTSDGEYVHAAPWSVGDQGVTNVSHGCVNLSTDNAAWFYDLAQRGDVVEVVGSPKPPEPNDGLIEWNQSFAQWRAGSALPRPQPPINPV